VGVTGTEVLVTVPLSMLGAAYGTPLNGIVVTSTLLASAAPPQDIDTLTLPDAVLSGPIVRIGIAAPNVPAEAVNYTGAATPDVGGFTATFNNPADGKRGRSMGAAVHRRDLRPGRIMAARRRLATAAG
jgi:hypothetical protein